MSFAADIAIERRDIAMSAMESAFQNNYIADNVLAKSKYVFKTKKVQKKEKTIDVIDDVQIEGPFAFGDTGRSEPRIYQSFDGSSDEVDTTVCHSMFPYLSYHLTDKKSFEYRAIAEEDSLNASEKDSVEVFDFIIVGAAAVYRNESPRLIVAYESGDYDPDINYADDDLDNFSRYSRREAYTFLKTKVKELNIKQISHIHAFCGNDAVKGVGEPLMKEIKRREARAANNEYCLIVLWSVPEAVGFYEKLEFKCATPKNVDEWREAFYNWKGTKDALWASDYDYIQNQSDKDDEFNEVFMYCVVQANPQKLKRQRDEI